MVRPLREVQNMSEENETAKKHSTAWLLIVTVFCSFWAYQFGHSAGLKEGRANGIRLEACMAEEQAKGFSTDTAFDFCSPPANIEP